MLKKVIVNSKSLNICIASSGIQGPTGAGGVAKCTLNLIELVDRINRDNTKDINLTILYTADPFYHSKNYEYWKGYFESKYLNVRFEKIDSSRKVYGSKMMKRSYDIMNYFINSEVSFDKIIFHDYQGIGFYTLLAKKSLLGLENTEIIVNTHGNLRLSSFFGKKPICDSDDLITMYMELKSVELADNVISPSKFYLDWWQQQIGENKPILNCEVLHNITLKEVETEFSVDVQKSDVKKSISFFGRLEVLKGVELLTQALLTMSENDEYKEFFNDLEINFIGNPVEIYGVNSVDYIKEKCNSFVNRINFITDFNTKQAFEFMLEKKSVMVFPTLGENSPCVISEALINDVPFIAADIPGIKELVNENSHQHNLFLTNNKQSLIDGIIRVVTYPKKAAFSVPPNKTIERWISILTRNAETKVSNIAYKNQPLVSIVIPTFNRYEELDIALASIKLSSYKNIEIVVVDDGSDDKNELERVCIKHGAKLIFGQKMFKGAASNLGVSSAIGEYILFFDDDDILHSDAIEKYVNYLEYDLSTDFVSCFCDVFDNKAFQETGKIKSDYTSMSLGDYKSGNLISNYFGKGSFIIRKDKFKEMGGFDEDCDSTHMVDYRFYVKAVTFGLKLHIIPSSLYSYRKNSNGSLFYESQGDPIKLYNAKSRILNTIKELIDPSLHDLFSTLYMSNSNPKFQFNDVNKIESKWLGESKELVNVIFKADFKRVQVLKLISSDLSELCEVSFDFSRKFLFIKSESISLNERFSKLKWLDKDSVSFSFLINDKNLTLKSNDLNVEILVPIGNIKHKNIRKLIMDSNFHVC